MQAEIDAVCPVCQVETLQEVFVGGLCPFCAEYAPEPVRAFFFGRQMPKQSSPRVGMHVESESLSDDCVSNHHGAAQPGSFQGQAALERVGEQRGTSSVEAEAQECLKQTCVLFFPGGLPQGARSLQAVGDVDWAIPTAVQSCPVRDSSNGPYASMGRAGRVELGCACTGKLETDLCNKFSRRSFIGRSVFAVCKRGRQWSAWFYCGKLGWQSTIQRGGAAEHV